MVMGDKPWVRVRLDGTRVVCWIEGSHIHERPITRLERIIWYWRNRVPTP